MWCCNMIIHHILESQWEDKQIKSCKNQGIAKINQSQIIYTRTKS